MRNPAATLIAITLAALPPFGARAQDDLTVQGVVRSASGQRLAGAGVFLEMMNLGAISNDTGGFAFRVPAASLHGQKAALSARLIGWRQKTDTVVLLAGTLVSDIALDSSLLLWSSLGRLKASGTDSIALARGVRLPGCLPIDADDGSLLWFLREDITDTSDLTMKNKSLSKLPTIDSAHVEHEVTQVERGPLCARAQRAVRGAFAFPDSVLRRPPERVRLVRVRDLYLVNDPKLNCGEWTSWLTFNSKWELLAVVMR